MSTQQARVSIKRVRPNPLFQDWLEELYEESVQKNSKLEPMLREAKESLAKYPLPLKSGKECAILQGFKKQLCEFLDLRLDVYTYNLSIQLNDAVCQPEDSAPIDNPRANENTSDDVKENKSISSPIPVETEENALISISSITNPCVNLINIQDNEPMASGSGILTKKQINYVSQITASQVNDCDHLYEPLPQSGAYSLLKALLEHLEKNPQNPSLVKKELIDNAQKYCDPLLAKSSIWNEIYSLIRRGYVLSKKSRKTVYFLSQEGVRFAKIILNKSLQIPVKTFDVDIQENDQCCKNKENSSQLLDIVKLPANSFDIVLLIDKNENIGVASGKPGLERVSRKFPDLKYEYRSLKVGDFTWIARHKVNTDQELVLPYIVERKRMDDLASSIKDGRFHEQKFRLEKCGLDNVIYLVEKYGKNKYVGLPLQTLKQAMTNTRVQDNFKIQVTESIEDSFIFLALMTKRLTGLYQGKDLQGTDRNTERDDLMTFKHFNSASSKRKALTVSETFIKMLLQLKGLSVEKALAISNKYNTSKNLIEAYKNCEDRERCGLLANIKFGESNRNVGNTVSKTMHHLFAPANESGSNINTNY